MMTREDLQDYLVYEAEYEREMVERMDSELLVHSWLQWNGILGYTDDILDVVQAAFNTMDEVREEVEYK